MDACRHASQLNTPPDGLLLAQQLNTPPDGLLSAQKLVLRCTIQRHLFTTVRGGVQRDISRDEFEMRTFQHAQTDKEEKQTFLISCEVRLEPASSLPVVHGF